MSQENVERIKAGFAAHNRGDLDASLYGDLCHGIPLPPLVVDLEPKKRRPVTAPTRWAKTDQPGKCTPIAALSRRTTPA